MSTQKRMQDKLQNISVDDSVGQDKIINKAYQGDESQIENSVKEIIDFGYDQDEYDLNSSQMHQVVNNNQFPMSSKSQQNQSFIMNNSVMQLNNPEYNEEKGSLNSAASKNLNSAKTNVYSNNTSFILNGSIIDDNSFKSPSLKKNIKIGKEQQSTVLEGEQNEEINIARQFLVNTANENYQSQPKQLKKPTHLPPIQRYQDKKGQNEQDQDNSSNGYSNNNSNQNSIIMKAKDLLPRDKHLSHLQSQQINQQQIEITIIKNNKDNNNSINNKGGDANSLTASGIQNKSLLQLNKKKKHSCIQVLFPKCKLRSTVTAMCTLFVVFFIIQLILESVNKQKRACTAYKIGCEFQPSVTNGGEVHRLIISSLLHASWFNIASSLFTFMFYGYVLEAHYGVARMVILYLVCAFSGNIFVGVIDPYEIQIGPNSIIMGLFTLQATFLFTIYKRIPKSKKKPIIGMFILLIITNFLCIVESLTVKASSYLGGIISGIFLSFAYYKAYNPSKKFIFAQRASYVALAVINIAMFAIAMSSKLDDIQISDMGRCSA